MHVTENRQRPIKTTLHGLVWLAALIALGCGRRDALPLAPVTGTVTYHGEPLGHGSVVFQPIEGTPGPSSVGQIVRYHVSPIRMEAL